MTARRRLVALLVQLCSWLCPGNTQRILCKGLAGTPEPSVGLL